MVRAPEEEGGWGMAVLELGNALRAVYTERLREVIARQITGIF